MELNKKRRKNINEVFRTFNFLRSHRSKLSLIKFDANINTKDTN
jgi:hypothetical protein